MNETSHPDTLMAPQMPWWLGRGVGLALVLAMGAVVSVCSWGIATYAATPPLPAAQRYEDAERVQSPSVAFRNTSAGQETRTEPIASDPPDTGEVLHPGLQPSHRHARSTSRDRTPAVRISKERKSARIRRAVRSDRELAAFIASVGVVDERELWVTPISVAYRITATFGQSGSLWSRDHTGVDLAAPTGTAVASVAAGTVTNAGQAGAYGLKAEVTHRDGTVTWYAHLSRIDVIKGQHIEVGASIGTVGATGNVTGPHLHLELRPNGALPVDPVAALAAYGVQL